MKVYSVIFLVLFAVTIILPAANGQIPGQESHQKSINVTIGSAGDMHVIHVIKKLDSPKQIDLMDGTRSNLTVHDEEGNDVDYGQIGNGDSVLILPSNNEIVIEYDLADKLIVKENVWTLDFFYLDSVAFLFPEQVEVVIVNNQPAYLGEKNGILCHGCQMILEYSIDKPSFFENIKIQDEDFLVEIRTWAKIDLFSFDPESGFDFEVIGKNRLVTAIVPVDLLSEPYQVSLDEEELYFYKNLNNETHVWLNMRISDSGEVSIIGTVVPEMETVPEGQIRPEILIAVIIIIGVVIAGVFFFKRKN